MQAAIRNNAFTENVGTDWVAIDHTGNPIARAGDEATVRRAAPNAERYLTGEDLIPAVLFQPQPPEEVRATGGGDGGAATEPAPKEPGDEPAKAAEPEAPAEFAKPKPKQPARRGSKA